MKALEKQIANLDGLIRRAIKKSAQRKYGVKRPLMIRDLRENKWIAIAQQFLLTRELSIENLQTELDSKKESKQVLAEYIKSAKSR